jgi:hypothetical protein
MLSTGRLHVELDNDRFAAGQPIALREDLSELRFRLESDNPDDHTVRLWIGGLPAGRYAVGSAAGVIASFDVEDPTQPSALTVPVTAATRLRPLIVTRL